MLSHAFPVSHTVSFRSVCLTMYLDTWLCHSPSVSPNFLHKNERYHINQNSYPLWPGGGMNFFLLGMYESWVILSLKLLLSFSFIEIIDCQLSDYTASSLQTEVLKWTWSSYSHELHLSKQLLIQVRLTTMINASFAICFSHTESDKLIKAHWEKIFAMGC